MADVTRRGFLTQASVATGIGMAGGLGLDRLIVPTSLRTDASPSSAPDAPAPQPVAPGPQPVAPSLNGVTLAGPMLVHIRDVASGEISMMVGTRELVYRDTELVSHLVQTAVSAGKAED
jgi:hypothetical protein